LFYQARSLADHACRESDRGLADANRQLEIIPALRMLGLGLSEYDEDLTRLARFLQPQFPLALQQAALAGLRRATGKLAAQAMLASWKASSPTLRSELLSTLFTRREWIQELLTALEQGQVAASQLATPEQQKL